jgi:dTMP kinase
MLNAARAQLVNSVIQPALVGGDVVLADRFFDATLAYQGYGRGGDLAAMRTVIDIAIGPCIPACTLLLDVSVETARRRLEQRGASNFFDSMGPAFAQRVRDGYLALAYAEPGRFLVLDGEAAPEDVCVRLLKELSRRGIVL